MFMILKMYVGKNNAVRENPEVRRSISKSRKRWKVLTLECLSRVTKRT